jgi:hypothetical protein
MSGMEWMLDIVLVVLLTATLFHAVRLERALGVLKRDRTALEALVASFNASTRCGRNRGVERLRAATDGAGRQIQRQIDIATTLKDDLTFPGAAWRRSRGSARRPGTRARVPPSLSPSNRLLAHPRPLATAYLPQVEPCAGRTEGSQPGRARPVESTEDGAMTHQFVAFTDRRHACCR